jgi:hypothetical protein
MACCEIVRYDPALLVRMERDGSKVARKASGCVGIVRGPSSFEPADWGHNGWSEDRQDIAAARGTGVLDSDTEGREGSLDIEGGIRTCCG